MMSARGGDRLQIMTFATDAPEQQDQDTVIIGASHGDDKV